MNNCLIGMAILVAIGGGVSAQRSGAPAAATAKTGTLNGDVFIVTKGGLNYKLGLVAVRAIPASAVASHIAQKRLNAEAETAKLAPQIVSAEESYVRLAAEKERAWKTYIEGDILNAANKASFAAASKSYLDAGAEKRELISKRDFYDSEAFFLDGMPSGIATAKTDADGKFALTIPKNGRFAIVANAKRMVGAETEEYYWIVWTSLNGQPSKRLMLSNDNMVGAGSAESALK